MDKQAYLRYQSILEQISTDPEYMALQEILQEVMPEAQNVFSALTQEQKDALFNLYGVLQEMELRILELVCFGSDRT